MDEKLLNESTVLGHKLCGAGNGGFFLTISQKDSLVLPYSSVKVGIDEEGVVGHELS